MAAKDGSFSFNFQRIYADGKEEKLIAYGHGDGRNVKITFENLGKSTQITETFDPEDTNRLKCNGAAGRQLWTYKKKCRN